MFRFRTAAAAPGRAPIYVKVDCGLGRLGVPIEDAADFIRRLVDLPGLAIEGLYTHLPFFDAAGQSHSTFRRRRSSASWFRRDQIQSRCFFDLRPSIIMKGG